MTIEDGLRKGRSVMDQEEAEERLQEMELHRETLREQLAETNKQIAELRVFLGRVPEYGWCCETD